MKTVGEQLRKRKIFSAQRTFARLLLEELEELHRPASLAHFRTDVTSLPFCVLQIPLRAAALTPTVFRLVFTPHRNAVAVAALSGIWKSTL